MKSIAVYLGSFCGKGELYMRSAREIGRGLARKGFKVIYGGANVGTMSALADGVNDEKGYLIGVIPKNFGGKRHIQAQHKDILYKELTECIFVKDMAERKTKMEELSDCALILPGSLGTLDELFCYSVDNQIAIHDKIVYVLNENGYYDGLYTQLQTFVDEGFLHAQDIGKGSEGSVIRFINSIDEIDL